MLFRNEYPNLGPATTVNEGGLIAASNAKTGSFDYKPTTREIVSLQVPTTAASSGTYFYEAPWKCQVVAIHFNQTVISTGAATGLVEKISADSVVPAASGTNITPLHTAVDLHGGTINTRVEVAISATLTGATLNPGDQLALFTSASTAGLAGYFQVDIVQLG